MTKGKAFPGLKVRTPALEPKQTIAETVGSETQSGAVTSATRQGKKAMTGYFSPAMSFAMNMTARKNEMSLQAAMGEAFNDWLVKMGESPVE